MGIKKYSLKPKKLRNVSSPGQLASELDNKPNKSDIVQVALLEWDFEKDGGAEGEYDVTDKFKNLFPIGAVVIKFYMAVDKDFEFTDTASLAITDNVGPDSYMGANAASTFDEGAAFYQELLGLNTPSVPASYYISNEDRRRMRLLIADGDITKGKFRLWLTWLK